MLVFVSFDSSDTPGHTEVAQGIRLEVAKVLQDTYDWVLCPVDNGSRGQLLLQTLTPNRRAAFLW